MTNRSIIRLFSFALCFVAVLAAYAIIGNNQSRAYKTRLEASYQQSLTELSECLDSIETNLTKSEYATTPTMMANLSEDLYSECTTAKNALSHLPIDQLNLSGTYKFLSQAADYADYLCDKTNSGVQISDEEYNNLQQLLKYAKAYADSIDEMVTRCSNGGQITDNEIESANAGLKVSSLSLDFTQAEETFSDYPTLLYDGPFADAVLNRKPAVTENSAEVSREEALKTAAKAVYSSEDKVTYTGEENGTIPCYDFTCEGYKIAISKNGGYVAYIIGTTAVESKSITEENAVNIASAYLKRLGYNNMTETYYAVNDNVCVVNFAYSEKSVIYYADLIKVGISMSNGKIYSLEAEGFLTNHKTRDDFSVNISESELRNKLSTRVDVLSARSCVIPKSNGKEAPCIEFHCRSKNGGDEVLVYINTITGEEENILLLLYSDNGTLTK